MSQYVISCCSMVDLKKAYLDARGIRCLCLPFRIGEKEYIDDFGETIPYEEFYAAMRNGIETGTAQPGPAAYEDMFSAICEEGKDIVHVSFSSGLSGCFNTARICAQNVMERYPERRIVVVDSLCASSGYGLFVDKLADLRDAGASLEELCDWAEKHKAELQHLFFSTDLSYYYKGGRISRASAVIGGVLDICPMLDMNNEGKLVPRSKNRGVKRSVRDIVERMAARVQDGEDYSGKCFISQSDMLDAAKEVAALVEARFPKLCGKVEINSVGTMIGCHTGPGTVALFFWGEPRGE